MVVTLGFGPPRCIAQFQPLAVALGLGLTLLVHLAALHVVTLPPRIEPATDLFYGLTYIQHEWHEGCLCAAPTAAQPILPAPALPTVASVPLPDFTIVDPVVRVLPRVDQARSRLSNMSVPWIRILEDGATVRLRVLVDRDGKVDDVKLDRSSGYPGLDRSAIDGARRWLVFIPGTEDGSPAAMWMPYQVVFRWSE